MKQTAQIVQYIIIVGSSKFCYTVSSLNRLTVQLDF